MTPRKVLLLEFNEINWSVIDKLIAAHGVGYLPNFSRLRRAGSVATQVAEERAPNLDPWITWVTVHTGVPHEVHRANVMTKLNVHSFSEALRIAFAAGMGAGD